MLKWLTKKVYSSLSEVLAAVYKELDSLQPVDTDTVKWTKGLTGMRAHAVAQNSPVAMNQVQEDGEVVEYASYFKIIKTTTALVVCDGANTESTIAGYITPSIITVLRAELPLVVGKIFLEVIYNSETHGYTYAFYQGSAISGSTNHGNPLMWYKELGEYTRTGTIIQRHDSGNIEIIGRWL
jgi:hypothetical protein